MSWKYVLNCLSFEMSLDSCALRASDLRYKFICFNGLVYYINDKREPEQTGLTARDLV